MTKQISKMNRTELVKSLNSHDKKKLDLGQNILKASLNILKQNILRKT